MTSKKSVGRPRVHKTASALKAAKKEWNDSYTAKKQRIDMLVDPEIYERWKTYVEASGLKREKALSELLKNEEQKMSSLGYLQNIILEAFKNEGHHPDYLEEKRTDLLEIDDSTRALSYLNGRESLYPYLSKKLDVTVDELRSAVRVAGQCWLKS